MKIKKYDVTIGIPMYNAEDFIQRTMESALSQTYDKIEFLVVDDASTDNSLSILNNIIGSHPRGSDVRVISLSNNQGPSCARNAIIEKAQGDYLYFMDSDDVIRTDTISLMMQYVRSEKADIVFGSLEKVALDGKRIFFRYPELHFHKEDELATYAYRKYAGIQASACNILARLSIIRDNNLRFYDSNYWEDFAFVLDLVTYYKHAVLLSEITYSYFCRENSLSNFQTRNLINKSEVLRNVGVAKYMKDNCARLSSKVYFPQRCYVTVMTDFYIACYILKHRQMIVPSFTNSEIKQFFYHPASLREICMFQNMRMENLFLFLLGKVPSLLCVSIIWILGKLKKIV